MRSIIFSLIDPVGCCVLNRALPNNAIRFLGNETSNPASFPGWPSFGDLLCDGGSRNVVGLSFHIPTEHLFAAERLGRELSPKIVELKRPSAALGLYEKYSNSAWLEIKWSPIVPNRLVEIQTCDVLWYYRSDQLPVALGIEHLEGLVKEADYDLVVPSEFPFPKLEIEFLND